MVERVGVVVLVVRVGVGVRHRAGRLVRQGVPVRCPVSVSPVRAEGPGLVRRPGVRQGERRREVPGGGGVPAGHTQLPSSPGLAATPSLHYCLWVSGSVCGSLSVSDLRSHITQVCSLSLPATDWSGPAARPPGGERERANTDTVSSQYQ